MRREALHILPVTARPLARGTAEQAQSCFVIEAGYPDADRPEHTALIILHHN